MHYAYSKYIGNILINFHHIHRVQKWFLSLDFSIQDMLPINARQTIIHHSSFIMELFRPAMAAKI